MAQRIYKRRSSGKCTRNSETSTKETRNEPSSTVSPSDAANGSETIVPNRVFVGGITDCISEWNIQSEFENYGNVTEVRIIRNRTGLSKGYGFVTYSTNEEAKNALEKAEVIVNGRKLKTFPAVKKQNYHSESSSSQESTSAKSYPDYLPKEIHTSRFCNSNSARFSEYQATFINEIPLLPNNTPRASFDSGMFHNAVDHYPTCGNSLVNCPLSYPAVVFIQQPPYPCPAAGITYPIGTIFPEMVHFVPASLTCLHSDQK
ncbi:uncharacterized protein LOC118195968 isoform X1 [Stegodyphus dumicola]|uniref:uncharacterized protein LOC118195968 isoform X1 n=1 Tax=Stegodyphus dumicola TaxID=202533 RepID=UPI0015A96C8C|nr:uncharacterized protein LOC118195968 isoform X1 [Stegodyphus dumicola]